MARVLLLLVSVSTVPHYSEIGFLSKRGTFCSPLPALRCLSQEQWGAHPAPSGVFLWTIQTSSAFSVELVKSLIWPLKQLYEGDRTHSNDANKSCLIHSAGCNPIPLARRGTLSQAEQRSEDVLSAERQHWSHSPHSPGAVTTCSTCVGNSTNPGSPATPAASAGTPQNKSQTKNELRCSVCSMLAGWFNNTHCFLIKQCQRCTPELSAVTFFPSLCPKTAAIIKKGFRKQRGNPWFF